MSTLNKSLLFLAVVCCLQIGLIQATTWSVSINGCQTCTGQAYLDNMVNNLKAKFPEFQFSTQMSAGHITRQLHICMAHLYKDGKLLGSYHCSGFDETFIKGFMTVTN